MSYTINLTNGNVFAVIPSGTINQASSQTLIGQNYAGYGQFLDDNFIRLLECGANSTPPGAPLTGQLWFNTVAGILEVYTGSAFKAVGGSQASNTAPSSNAVGDLWYDTVNQQLNVWTGSQWLLVGPIYNASTGVTGALPGTIVDNTSTSHTVIELYVGNVIVGFISSSATFTPQTSISGFTTIRPGITLSTLVGNSIPLFQGTATNSQLLSGLNSTQFMRSDTNTSTTGVLGIQNNSGMTVGTNGDFGVSISGTTVNLTNNDLNGGININANIAGASTTVVAINGSNGSMSVLGNITSGNVTSNIVSATGNVTGGNVATTGIVSATGNITGSYILGNGAFLTGISSSGNVNYSNSNVSSFLAAFGSNVISTTGTVTAASIVGGVMTGTSTSVTGNITGSYILGNGAFLTGISSSGNVNYGNSNVSSFLAAFGSNIISTTGTVTASSHIGSVVSATGNITGSYILGNGAFLTGISGGGNVNYSNSNVSSFLAAFGSNTVSTTGSITSGSLNTTGNINLNGTGQRMEAVLSGTHSSRLLVQNSGGNGDGTAFGILPAVGTNYALVVAYSSTDADNSATVSFGASPSAHGIYSSGTISGTNSPTYTGLPITISLSPNGEAARFVNNGDFLIGTTTDNGTDKLQVNGSFSASGNVTTNNDLIFTGTGAPRILADMGPGTGDPGVDSRLYLQAFPGQNTRVAAIPGSGNVNSLFAAHTNGSDPANSAFTFIQGSGTNNTGVVGTGYLGTGASWPLVFQTINTEKARIDTSGNFMLGTTTQSGSNLMTVNGSIGATGFNNTSDYRLKENILPITNALDKVCQLNPVTFTWKKDGTAADGFIAHELQQVLPLSVSGIKDGKTATGRPVYQQVDKSSLVATLTAAIQELNATVAELKDKLKAAGVSGF